MRPVVVIALGLVGLTGCDDEPPRARPSAFDAGPPPSFSAARRPAETVYLERESERCAVYWQANGVESVKKEVRCPRDLELGERLRLTGRTCHRESPTGAREVPVRCASPLFQVERALATGTGEYHLPPAR
jgi:hypothetical protein